MIKRRSVKDIGNMNREISLQELSRVGDAAGGINPVWTDWITTWSAVSDSSGMTYSNINQHTETVQGLKFVIRYNPLIYAKPVTQIRVVYSSRAYRIRNIKNVDQSDYYLELICDGNEWEAG